jgi:hypothetical protein
MRGQSIGTPCNTSIWCDYSSGYQTYGYVPSQSIWNNAKDRLRLFWYVQLDHEGRHWLDKQKWKGRRVKRHFTVTLNGPLKPRKVKATQRKSPP